MGFGSAACWCWCRDAPSTVRRVRSWTFCQITPLQTSLFFIFILIFLCNTGTSTWLISVICNCYSCVVQMEWWKNFLFSFFITSEMLYFCLTAKYTLLICANLQYLNQAQQLSCGGSDVIFYTLAITEMIPSKEDLHHFLLDDEHFSTQHEQNAQL